MRSSSGGTLAILPASRARAIGTAEQREVIARFLPNGALDPTFDSDGVVISDFTIPRQPDGQALVVGRAWSEESASSDFLALRMR